MSTLTRFDRLGRFCLLVFAAAACNLAAADPPAQDRSDGPSDKIRALREQYQAAEADLGAKEALVTEALAAGDRTASGLRGLVRHNYNQRAAKYWPRIRKHAAKQPDQSSAEVLDSVSAKLRAQREALLRLATMYDRLDAVAAGDRPRKALNTQFEERERKLITATGNRRGISIRVRPDEAEVMRLTNALRKQNGLSPLKMDKRLVATARDHGADMERHEFFAHESPVEGKLTPLDRAIRFETTANAENLVISGGPPQEVLEMWMGSPGHLANILQPEMTRIGVGRFGNFWTALYGL